MITVVLKTYIPTAQHDEHGLILATPSPTWLFSSISPLAATPVTGSHMETPADESRIASSRREAAGQLTPTPHPEQVRQGQFLFYAIGCFQCHGVKGEGFVGPSIARTELSLDRVMQQVYQPLGDMPVFSEKAVGQSDVAAIYAYLQSLEPTGPHPEITADCPDSAMGELLYRYFGCFGCHGYQGEGGFGPRLAGTQLSLEELRSQVRTSRARMPDFPPERIGDEELACIYAFLRSLTP